jgi:2-hydroxy-6-oxonona-2,4-dienedioate hydrolase
MWRSAVDEARYVEAERRLWTSVGATPTDQRVHLERNDVNVRLQHVGEGPMVVFVHGANTSGASWASLAARLSDFHCVIVDRPGTGLSEPLRHAMDANGLAQFADTLVVDVLDALEVESAHLVATSLGGYIALRSAAAHPDRVGRMVQFSWPVGAMVAQPPAFMRMMCLPLVGRVLSAVPPTERTVRLMFRQIGHGRSLADGRISQADLDCFLAMLRHTNTMRNELTVGRQFASRRGLSRLVLADSVLARIRAPTYFLWGENDPFGGPEIARRLVDRLPNAELELMPGAGHSPWLDDLDHVAATTHDFLSRTVG